MSLLYYLLWHKCEKMNFICRGDLDIHNAEPDDDDEDVTHNVERVQQPELETWW